MTLVRPHGRRGRLGRVPLIAVAISAWLVGAAPSVSSQSMDPAAGESPVPTPSFQLSEAGEASNNEFLLTITVDDTRATVGQPIRPVTTLSYVGAAETFSGITPTGGPVHFRVEQLDGPVDMGPALDSADTAPIAFQAGQQLDIPFTKSGTFDATDPQADFWRDWLADPELRLPEGTYRITAVLDVRPAGDGSTAWDPIEASLVVAVAPPAFLSALEALECDGPPSETGGDVIQGEGPSPTPEEALASSLDDGWTVPQSGYEESMRTEDQILYTFRVDGRVKAGVVTTRAEGLEGWDVSQIRVCAMSELGADPRLPGLREVWIDGDGRTAYGFAGNRHCDLQSLTQLSLDERDGMSYVRDPQHRRDGEGVRRYLRDARLPRSAIDTGLRRGDDTLWLSEDRETVFVVLKSGRVERWPGLRVRCG